MFKVTQSNHRYHVRYCGSDDKDLLIFYNYIYSLPSSHRTFYQNGYWLGEEAYKGLLQAQTTLKLTPYSYQQEAIDFALAKQSSLAMLPCGSGKTFIGIGAYAQAKARGLIATPGLIVVKASLKYQWAKEIEKFSCFKPHIIETKAQLCSYELSKLKKAQSKEEKEEWLLKIDKKFNAQFENVDLFIANYESLTDSEIRSKLHALKIDFIMADEIHYDKNYKAKRSQSLAEFKTAKIKIGATATPIQKDYCDAYGIFSILVPTLYKNFSEFATRHIRYGGFGRIIGFKNTDALMIRLKPYLFLKTEEDIASQLPEMMPPIQLWCDPDPKVKAMCQTIFEELAILKEEEKILCAKFKSQAEYENSEERMQLEGKIMALQTFSQELADAPELLEITDSNMAKNYCINSKYVNPKLELLAERVAEIIDSGEKVVIFSRFERMQDIIERRLKKEDSNLIVAKVHGGIKGEERYQQANVLFKENPNCKVLLASNSMAEGISLSWCKYLIEYDLAESYAIQTQRHGRIRRADSIHQTLFVYQILMRDTWDQIALKIVSKKEAMDQELKS